MTRHRFRLGRASPGRRQPRHCIAPGHVAFLLMAPAPNPGPSAATLVAGLAAIGFWRLSAVAAPHMAALAIMLETEADFGGRMGFALAWGILNFCFIALLPGAAITSSAISPNSPARA